MARIPVVPRAGGPVVAVLGTAWVTGCVFVPPPPGEPSGAPQPVPVAAALPPPPPPSPAPPAPAAPVGLEIAVLFDADSRDHTDVAAMIAALLTGDAHRVTLVDVRDPGVRMSAPRSAASLAVAVGLEAAAYARRELRGPLVFCQIFNHETLLEPGTPVWGVAALPPLGLQLRAWKALDPSLASVGLIVAEPHTALAAEAVAAGLELGIAVRYEVAASDRETAYLFKRLAPQVDGFWLPPDNRILSPGVLRELLEYAAGHRVGVGVANDALLGWGALLSTSGTRGDVARTVRRVVAEIANGAGAELPPLTPLSEVELALNERVATELGVDSPPEPRWVLREPD